MNLSSYFLAYRLLSKYLTSRYSDHEPLQQHDPIARGTGLNASGNIPELSPERTYRKRSKSRSRKEPGSRRSRQ